MNRYLYIILLLAALLSGGCATAQKGALIRAHSAINDGRFTDALKRLSEAEKFMAPTPDLQAEISFLRAQSYEGLMRLPEAVGSYRYVVATFPGSIYAFQAKERLKELEPNQSPEPTQTGVGPKNRAI